MMQLFFIAAWHEITVGAVHIPGRDNTLADANSRNHIDVFFQQAPQASAIPSAIPETLMDLLISQQPDWTSPTDPDCSSALLSWFSFFYIKVLCLRAETVSPIL